MSNWREQYEDESGFGVFLTAVGHSYHYVLGTLLAVFALWNRARNYTDYLVRGKVLYRGNDPWYTYRSVQYTVNNYPQTMPYEVWTYFPEGTASSQFGTFFGQLIATMALIVGLGSPSEELVRKVVLVSPAIFGMLVIVPAYFVGRRLGGRFGGVMSASLVAFAPDGLLVRSVAGFSDHHVAEALFQSLAVLAVMVALSVAQREKPVYELLVDREFDALRRPIGYSVLAGVAIAMYLWTWPPGVLLLGILGVFFAIHLSAEVVRGKSPEHTALVGTVALSTAGLLQLAPLATLELSATARSVLQPGLALAVAFGCLFMTWLFRQWESQDLSKNLYPVAVLGILLALAGFTAVVLPDIFSYFVDQVLRVVGFQTSPSAGTIGEAQPLRSPLTLWFFYRMAILTAVGGFLIVIGRQFLAKDPPAEGLLVAVWFVFIIAATFTQARFSYYLTVPVGGLTAVVVGVTMQYVDSLAADSEVEPYEAMTVLSVVLILVAPLFLSGLAVQSAAMQRSERASAPGGIIGWSESLDWMENNTPAEGQYANPDGKKIEYYGTFARDENYDYPKGAYGVMSWWDYGHWITVEGERIPNANPFQQGADMAAKFLTAQSEERAQQVLKNIDENDAKTRYVMVDWKMATAETQVGGKYFAPLRFNPNTSRSEHYSRVLDVQSFRESGSVFTATNLIRHKKPYYNSTIARLYWYHGSAKSPDPVVLDWQGAERDFGNGDTFVQPPQDGQTVKRFRTLSAARDFVENDSTSQLGGVGAAPTHRIPAMEHYRLVHMDETSALVSPQFRRLFQRNFRNNPGLSSVARARANVTTEDRRAIAENLLWAGNSPSWVKTFERVPGATIEGTGGPADATLTLQVEMNPANGQNFTYTKQVQTDENGSFTATVPYATTDYDALGPDDGYTNTSVRATGPYRIVSDRLQRNGSTAQWIGSTNVPEPNVVGANNSAVTVKMQRVSFGDPPSQNGSDDSTSNDSTTGGSTTSDSTTTNSTSGASAKASERPAVTDSRVSRAF